MHAIKADPHKCHFEILSLEWKVCNNVRVNSRNKRTYAYAM